MSKQSKERDRLLSIYNRFYVRHEYDVYPDGYGCYYCGEPSETIDHCPPISHIEDQSIADWNNNGYKLLKVSCCSSCNTMLSNRALYTLADRLVFLNKKLNDEYDKKSVLWSEEELAEMSIDFQRQIRAKQNMKFILVDRIRAIQWRMVSEGYIL